MIYNGEEKCFRKKRRKNYVDTAWYKAAKGEYMKNITLEMSMKPFKRLDDEYVEGVVRRMFCDWRSLLNTAESVGVMLYIADGSEILDYNGDMSAELEWCRYIGTRVPYINANSLRLDPKLETLMTSGYFYIDEPPVLTLGAVKRIVSVIKSVGEEMFPDKRVIVGEMFDPGGEFTDSDFKYRLHPECCESEFSGSGDMVCCFSTLKGDGVSYAGFPDGIPEGTPFGRFFGRQCRAFCRDMGFDFLWFSNGFGFGVDSWSSTGAVFDGESFRCDNLEAAKEKNIGFWREFRRECPDIEIQTRGSNMTAGIDYSSDAVPLYEIYKSVDNLLPPPNSPWAAIDGDFGLELAGFMSRVAEMPGEDYLFRYYLHDPWFMNSPWYDRYEGQPHDIYLPLSTSVINGEGRVITPSNIHIFSVDNSLGDMPESCVREPLPHIFKAIKDFPDAPSPVVWVYPFREYLGCKDSEGIKEVYSEDWFIRGAINSASAISSIVSTDNFISSYRLKPDSYSASVLVTPVPESGSEFESELLSFIERGGRAVLYGSPRRASERVRTLIGVESAEGRSGRMRIGLEHPDSVKGGYPCVINHNSTISAGDMEEVLREGADVEPLGYAGDRLLGTVGCGFAWVRATVSCRYKKGELLLSPDDEKELFRCENLLRYALSRLGVCVHFEKRKRDSRIPVLMISRSDNAFMLSAYVPDTTVKTRLRLPGGAPVLMGYETELADGMSTYSFPRAVHAECRVLVRQNSGILSCREIAPVDHIMRRRIELSGLESATVRFYAESEYTEGIDIRLNSEFPHVISEKLEARYVREAEGGYYEVEDVSGTLLFSMPRIPDPNFKKSEINYIYQD